MYTLQWEFIFIMLGHCIIYYYQRLIIAQLQYANATICNVTKGH